MEMIKEIFKFKIVNKTIDLNEKNKELILRVNTRYIFIDNKKNLYKLNNQFIIISNLKMGVQYLSY